MHLSDRTKLLLRAGVTLALMAYLLFSIDVSAIASTVSGMAAIPVLVCVPLVCAMYAIRTEKWRILLRAVDIDVDFSYALKIFLIGTFYGSVTPGRAGEVSRSFYMSDSKARTIPTVIVDRVTDIVCLLAMSVLMVLSVFHDLMLAAITLALVAGFAVLCTALLERRLVSAAARLFGIADERRDEYLSTVGTILHDRRALLSSLGMTLAYYILNIVVFWLVLRAISPAIDPLISLSLPLIIIMGNVPVSISGLGVRELVSVAVFSVYNESAAYGFSASLVMYALTTLLPGLVGSALSMGGVRPYGAEKREL